MLKIVCQNREITSYVGSTRVTLFSGVICVENTHIYIYIHMYTTYIIFTANYLL